MWAVGDLAESFVNNEISTKGVHLNNRLHIDALEQKVFGVRKMKTCRSDLKFRGSLLQDVYKAISHIMLEKIDQSSWFI